MSIHVFYIQNEAIVIIKNLLSIATNDNSIIEIVINKTSSYISLVQSFIEGADYTTTIANNLIRPLSLKYVDSQFIEYNQDIIDDYIVEKIVTISSSIKHIKQLLDNISNKNQIWLIDNTTDTISILYEDCLQKYSCRFNISHKNKPLPFSDKCNYSILCSTEQFTNLLETHHFLYGTIYSNIIGKHTTIRVDDDNKIIRLLSTNGRVMAISEIKYKHNNTNDEQVNHSIKNFKLTIDKGIIKTITNTNKVTKKGKQKEQLKEQDTSNEYNTTGITITDNYLLIYIGSNIIKIVKSEENVYNQIDDKSMLSYGGNCTRISISSNTMTAINNLYKGSKLMNESSNLVLQIHSDRIIINTNSKNALLQNTIRELTSIDGYKDSYKTVKISTWLDSLITAIKLISKLKVKDNVELILSKKHNYASINISEDSSNILFVIENYIVM